MVGIRAALEQKPHKARVALLHGDDGRVSLAPVYDVSPHAHLGRDRWAMSVAGGFDVRRTTLEDGIRATLDWFEGARA